MALIYFESIPTLHNVVANAAENNALVLNQANILDSLSFNQVAVIRVDRNPFGAQTNNTIQIHLGLYSLNGSTLSLANSAGATVTPAALTTSWQSLATSATQNISAGAWYFGVLYRFATGSINVTYLVRGAETSPGLQPGGPLVAGQFNTTTNALPASIHTTAITATAAGTINTPKVYILISA